jgi:hypothetical protein
MGYGSYGNQNKKKLLVSWIFFYIMLEKLKYRLQSNHYSLVLRKWTKEWKKE